MNPMIKTWAQQLAALVVVVFLTSSFLWGFAALCGVAAVQEVLDR